MSLRVESLNHACVLLSVSGVRLLFDPWLFGTAFSGGWGLRYENPRAIERAADATHLWISHWHSDHMHEPTLRALAGRRPDLEVLANVSHNFSMVERLRAVGFTKVVALGERTPLAMASGVTVTRYPTAGIDNMLHIAAPGASILNYNDCNLPERALRRLARRIGPVDLLLANYNHAGKLFERASDEAIQRTFFGSMVRAVEVMRPRHVVPFASSHVYRSRFSTAQNASLTDFDQLAAWTAHDPRYAVLRVGDALEVSGGGTRIEHGPAAQRAALDVLDEGPSVPFDQLVEHIGARSRDLAARFPLLGRWMPPLVVRVEDHDRCLRLELGRAPRELPGAAPADIRAHSRALDDWHGRKFGDDTFFAGAHFDLAGESASAIRAWALVTLLAASELDPRSLVRGVRSRSGLAFWWNRREEILGTLASGKVKAGELRS
jgi:L-ascorbate metabolism protein UlaG (beta-lactamase superfamily)